MTTRQTRCDNGGRRALLIHAGAVGDFVMSLRVVAATREAGASNVTVLGRPEIARIAVPGGGVDALLDLDGGGYHCLFSQELELPPSVREGLGRFDLAVNMLGGAGSPVSRRLKEAGIGQVIDIDPGPRRDWPGHVSDQWLADLQAAGVTAAVGPPRIRLGETSLRVARKRLEAEIGACSEQVVILHPGSGGRDKCWPLGNFIALAARLQSEGRRVAFLIGPVETERLSGEDFALLQATASILQGATLVEAVALIAASRSFVGNDSGMAHAAAALGCDTVVIYGPTDPQRWRPLGERVTIMQAVPEDGWPSMQEVARSIRKCC